MKLVKVWEIYEADTFRCICFKSKEYSDQQEIIPIIEFSGYSYIYITEEEEDTLEGGKHLELCI